MTHMGYSYEKLQGPEHVQLQDLPLSLSSSPESVIKHFP